jgi:alpha-glucosidase (family GH31 glycosyl hydrolase)
MFSPAILVNPVLKANATRHSVYLPPSPAWYDFWTEEFTSGGKEIEADAPLDRMPLYVRAGSILPMGPEIEYAAQDPGARLNFAFIAVPTAHSISMRMPATATTTRRGNIP